MDTFDDLERRLIAFEAAQFSAIQTSGACGKLPTGSARGLVQSVALDPSTTGERLPVVIALGINYYQTHRAVTARPEPLMGFRQHRIPEILDPELSTMRSVLDDALAAYRRNPPAWASACGGDIVAPDAYHLVALNRSPFITVGAWSKTPSTDRRAILAAWPEIPHVNAFVTAIVGRDDLWVPHGATFVWGFFNRWRRSHSVRAWLRSYNLSGFGRKAMITARTRRDPMYV